MTMRTKRGSALVALAVVVGLGLAGCTAAPATTSTGGPASPTVYSDANALVTEAQKEGSLSIYISKDYSYLVDGFKAAYPWANLDVTNGGASDLAQKWLTEAQSGISQVDIGFIQPLASHELETLGALADVQVPNDSLIPDALKGSPYAHSVNQQPIVIGYNTNLVTDPPTQLTDLADPKWKGQIILDDPALNSVTSWVLASTRAKWGDDKWTQWVDGIVANQPIFTNNAGDSYDSVLQGTRALCICTYGDFQAQDPNAPMKAVFYTDPNGTLEYSIVGSISATAKHPAMAALFLNWVLDPQGGQKAFSDNHRLPAVPVPDAATTLPAGATTTNVMPLIQDYIDKPDSYTAAWAGMEP